MAGESNFNVEAFTHLGTALAVIDSRRHTLPGSGSEKLQLDDYLMVYIIFELSQ